MVITVFTGEVDIKYIFLVNSPGTQFFWLSGTSGQPFFWSLTTIVGGPCFNHSLKREI